MYKLHATASPLKRRVFLIIQTHFAERKFTFWDIAIHMKLAPDSSEYTQVQKCIYNMGGLYFQRHGNNSLGLMEYTLKPQFK